MCKILKSKVYFFSLSIFFALSFSCQKDNPENPVIDPIDQCAGVAPILNVLSDFDCQLNYDYKKSIEIVENPNKTGINASEKVGKYIDDGTNPWDNLISIHDAPIDLSSKSQLYVKVYSSKAVLLKAKLEGGSQALEVDVNIETVNKWVEYSFDFRSVIGKENSKVVLFFNAGQSDGKVEDVYYVDDIRFESEVINPYDPCASAIEDLNVVSDFECQQNYTLGNPEADPKNPLLIENPYQEGDNTSNSVGKFTDDGTNAWDNLLIEFGDNVDLSTHNQVSLKVYSTKEVPLLVKFEGGGSVKEIWSTIDVANEWKEYRFDFRTVDITNTKLVFFFNGGQSNGTSEDIYYIDDIRFSVWVDPCLTVSEDSSIISDFECQQNYTLGNPDADPKNPFSIDNPNKEGLNTTSSVGQYTDDGTNAWDNLLIDFGDKIDLSTNNQVSIKIYSTKEVPLLVKFEGGGTAQEIWGSIDVVNEWKEYTFDFESVDATNTKLVLFFNGGQSNGTAEDVYFVDDIKILPKDCSAIEAECDGVNQIVTIISDFDCQQNYVFGNEAATVVENPAVSCQNRSSNVGRYVDDGTNAWDNLITEYGSAIDLSSTPILKLKVYSTRAVRILAKIESGGTPSEIWAEIDVVNEWKEYLFDFTGADTANTKLVLFFNGAETDGTAEDVYYVDDIRFEN